MTKFLFLAFGALILEFVSIGVGAQTQTPATVVVSSDVVPGELIVRYKRDLKDPGTKSSMSGWKGQARIAHTIKSLNIHHVVMNSGGDAQALITQLNHDPAVQYAEANHYVHLAQEYVQSGGSGNYEQSTANTQVPQAWALLTSYKSKPIVAVVDTGIDYTHYVFTDSSAVWNNSKEIPNNGIDDDGNGYIDDTQGWNFAYGTNNPYDDNGHGTHVSGIVIGVAQNITSIPLSASPILIMPLKFMDSTGTGTTSNAIIAIDYAVSNGAKVINNSWGGSTYSQSLHDALAYAYGSGLVIATAAGNYSSDDDSTYLYPASLPIPSQITVAATDNTDALAYFSSYGPSTVAVGSPGLDVYSTYPGNAFVYLSGTSMSTPFVAGLAALAFSQAPQLTGYQVKNLIDQSVTPVAGLQGVVSTGGRVDALGLVQAAQANTQTVAAQPAYNPVAPAGVSSGTTTGGAGCGLITTALTGRSGGNGMGPSGVMMLALLLLPLGVWVMVDVQASRTNRRRKYDRYRLTSAVHLNVDGREVNGRLATIGLGGVSFSSEALLHKGGTVTMMIEGPEGREMISVVGRIVWSENSHAYGVQFAPLKPVVQDQIRRWSTRLVKT